MPVDSPTARACVLYLGRDNIPAKALCSGLACVAQLVTQLLAGLRMPSRQVLQGEGGNGRSDDDLCYRIDAVFFGK
ncbi:hypothetical protein GCM10027396_18800 [Insolitispirillum peregrinum]